jgi:hypothetical protein
MDVRVRASWKHTAQIQPRRYICGFCGATTASKEGYYADDGATHGGRIYICSGCNCPTFFCSNGVAFPDNPPGDSITKAPNDISQLYEEARLSTAAGAFTAAVLICRKILMHIGVEKGAKAGESFLAYVEYLSKQGYLPPDGKGWVDYIRTRGNEANHEILLMKKEDAIALIDFTEMLLRFIYEFPHKIPPLTPPPPSSGGGAPGGRRP